MSNFAPAFGMIGTVIGMVLMLQNLTNPEALGAGIAGTFNHIIWKYAFEYVICTPSRESYISSRKRPQQKKNVQGRYSFYCRG